MSLPGSAVVRHCVRPLGDGLLTGSPGKAQPTHLKGQRFALPLRISLAAKQLVELQGHVGTVESLNDPGRVVSYPLVLIHSSPPTAPSTRRAQTSW